MLVLPFLAYPILYALTILAHPFPDDELLVPDSKVPALAPILPLSFPGTTQPDEASSQTSNVTGLLHRGIPVPNPGVPYGTNPSTGELIINGYQLIPPGPLDTNTRDPTAPIEFLNCDHIEAFYILNDISDAIKLAANALLHTNPDNRYFKAVFGKGPPSGSAPTDQEIEERYRSLTRIMDKGDKRAITFNCEDSALRKGISATTDAATTSAPTIWLNKDYLNAQCRIDQIAIPHPTTN